jgi:hypothetical protein
MNLEENDTPASPDRPLLPPAKIGSLKTISRDELLDKIESGEIQLNFSYLPSRPLGPEPLNIDTTRFPLVDPSKPPERVIYL